MAKGSKNKKKTSKETEPQTETEQQQPEPEVTEKESKTNKDVPEEEEDDMDKLNFPEILNKDSLSEEMEYKFVSNGILENVNREALNGAIYSETIYDEITEAQCLIYNSINKVTKCTHLSIYVFCPSFTRSFVSIVLTSKILTLL